MIDSEGMTAILPWILRKLKPPIINPPRGYFAGPWVLTGVELEYSFNICIKKICKYERLVGKYDEYGYIKTTSREVGCCDHCPMLDINGQQIASYADPFPPLDQEPPRVPWTPLPE
jgi:hypothetical protein